MVETTPARWRRRTFHHLLGVSSVPLAGCSAFAPGAKPFSELFGDQSVIYHHDELRLSIPQETIHVGVTLAVIVENTSNEPVDLGCGIPWTMQVYRDDQWKELIWTTASGRGACGYSLDAHQSVTETVTLTRSALGSKTVGVRGILTPGRYRFVLLSTSRFPAIDFYVEGSG